MIEQSPTFPESLSAVIAAAGGRSTVARELDVSYATVRAWALGRTRPDSSRLAQLLGLPPRPPPRRGRPSRAQLRAALEFGPPPRDPCPSIIGRSIGDERLDPRAATTWRARASHEFTGGACGVAYVDLLESVDCEDRGGIILRLVLRDYGSAMQPWAAVTPDGVEVHLPGDAESEAFRVGLIQALMMRKRAGDFLLGNAALEARPDDEPVEPFVDEPLPEGQ